MASSSTKPAWVPLALVAVTPDTWKYDHLDGTMLEGFFLCVYVCDLRKLLGEEEGRD